MVKSLCYVYVNDGHLRVVSISGHSFRAKDMPFCVHRCVGRDGDGKLVALRDYVITCVHTGWQIFYTGERTIKGAIAKFENDASSPLNIEDRLSQLVSLHKGFGHEEMRKLKYKASRGLVYCERVFVERRKKQVKQS